MAAEDLSRLSLQDDNYVMVAAIDFGTTFSGYAFSFKNSPDTIKMNKNWSETLGFQSYKTPTCILTGPDEKFEAFGYEAENKYADMEADEVVPENYQMYRQFKMMLYSNKAVTRDTFITSVSGKQRKALDVFVMALRFLKGHLLESVQRSFAFNTADDSLVKWVLTVPAIWSDEAKQFMREAAFQAGLIRTQDSRQLVIALEPEAASLYCRTLDINHFIGGDTGTKSANFKAGTKYMVIDAGGGTVDITAHEVLPTGQVRELHSANGGAWGGTKVEDNFVELLRRIMGTKFIDAYKKDCPQQWVMLMTNFEKVKKAVKPDGNSKLTIPLSWSMGNKYREVVGGEIESTIKEAGGTDVGFSNGSLIIKDEAIVKLFAPVVNEIVNHIEELMKIPKLQSCEYFMLVGGFGESSFLQAGIDRKFGHKICLLVPNEAQMSVIKGAVLFGHQPDAIKSRISRKTYGIKIRKGFVEGVHDPSKKEIREGYMECRLIFDPFIQVAEEVDSGYTKSVTYNALHRHQKGMGIHLFATDRPVTPDEVKYVDEEDVSKVGEFSVKMPDISKGINRSVQLDILFGGTEIKIHAVDLSSGSTTQASIDFLAD